MRRRRGGDKKLIYSFQFLVYTRVSFPRNFCSGPARFNLFILVLLMSCYIMPVTCGFKGATQITA